MSTTPAAAGIDLDRYLARIDARGRPGLAEIHRAHATTIPFENLDPHGGLGVSLAPEALEEKIVLGGRGGYCFEQNMLLRDALRQMGLGVELMLARVRWGAPAGVLRPRSHAVLRVSDGGQAWLADVGFGAGTLLEPIPFGVGGPYEQAGWTFRLVEDDGELVLQTEADGEWRDVYAIAPSEVPPIDLEVANWFTSTHPTSAFVSGLIVTAHRPDGTRVSLSDWNGLALVTRTPEGAVSVPVTRAEVPALLGEHFGLSGFALCEDQKVRPATAPPR